MRTRRTVFAFAPTAVVLLASGFGARAQALDKLKNTTPEQRAALQTELMATKLDLTSEQRIRQHLLRSPILADFRLRCEGIACRPAMPYTNASSSAQAS